MLALVLALVASAEPTKDEEAFLKEIDATAGLAVDADPGDVSAAMTVAYNCTIAFPTSWRCNLRAGRFGKWMVEHGFPDATLGQKFYAQVVHLAPAGDPAIAEAKAGIAWLARRVPPSDAGVAAALATTPVAVQREATYLKAVKELTSERAFDDAARLVEKCCSELPTFPSCHLLAGSVYARIANRDRSFDANQKAKRHYEQFLSLALPGDANIAKVRSLLEESRRPRVDAGPDFEP
jgi:hypothetical protein